MNNIEIVKKKRGRKPKNDINNNNIINNEEIDNYQVLNPSENEIIKKNKRGRKPKNIYSIQDISIIQESSLSDDENIIVKLNINEDNINNATEDELTIKETENHPCAYNQDEYNNLSNINNEKHIIESNNDESSEYKVVNLLKDFEEKNKVNEWPSNTSICCYWCCHKFENPPFGIPVYFKNNIFGVFGCVCSLECGAAYNFKMNDNIDEMWERYNLMNLLYRKLNLGKFVKPAPDRLSLKIFGGYLDISEFRKFFKSNKLININFPPMISLTQQIEEINDYEINNEFKYIPIDQDRIEKYKAKVLFKRVKPLINTKNSLESTMNLKYN